MHLLLWFYLFKLLIPMSQAWNHYQRVHLHDYPHDYPIMLVYWQRILWVYRGKLVIGLSSLSRPDCCLIHPQDSPVTRVVQKTRLGPVQVAGPPGKHGWEAAWGFQLPWLEKIPIFIEGSSSGWENHRTKGDFPLPRLITGGQAVTPAAPPKWWPIVS